MRQSGWHSIIGYRDFHDVPRLFVVRTRVGLVLFDCPFDEVLDDYPDNFTVSVLPEEVTLQEQDWSKLSSQALNEIGTIPVRDLEFDETRKSRVRLVGDPRALTHVEVSALV